MTTAEKGDRNSRNFRKQVRWQKQGFQHRKPTTAGTPPTAVKPRTAGTPGTLETPERTSETKGMPAIAAMPETARMQAIALT